MTSIRTRIAGLATAAVLAVAGQASAQTAPPDTVAAIRARGQVVCGVAVNSPGFALPDTRGEFRGLAGSDAAGRMGRVELLGAIAEDDGTDGRGEFPEFVERIADVPGRA